jgi:hypothetical protein
VYKYTSSSDFGAILLTNGIAIESYARDEPWSNWCLVPIKEEFFKYPEVGKYGLWIVQQTSSTPECAINVWNTKDKEVTIGISADVASAVGARLDASFLTGHESADWTYYNRNENVQSQFC